jgi:hypothetical protein
MKFARKSNQKFCFWYLKPLFFSILLIWITVFCYYLWNNRVDESITPGSPIHSLSWPPILENGSIPRADGYDIMPYGELRVPKFWKPSLHQPLEQSGSKVNSTESIFLMIASYRDFQCTETVASAFRAAEHPEALFIGIVDQSEETDDCICGVPSISCHTDPTHILCKYRDQISIYVMDAKHATGPVTARHVGQRLYRGQYFAMQLDAHCVFVRYWDSLIKSQWHSLHNEMAVLTHYMSDSQGAIDPSDGSAIYNSRAVLCNSEFETRGTNVGSISFMVHGVQPDEAPAISDMPQLQPFWAAGFSFSRGHFVVRVPYDSRLPMMFQV